MQRVLTASTEEIQYKSAIYDRNAVWETDRSTIRVKSQKNQTVHLLPICFHSVMFPQSYVS